MNDDRYDDELAIQNDILKQSLIIEQYSFGDAKKLNRKAKINEQLPVVQKYWLGRLAYEFAIRNNEIIAIMERCNELSNSLDMDSVYTHHTPRERCLALALDKYGFTSQPEDNVLKTEHTSFPAR